MREVINTMHLSLIDQIPSKSKIYSIGNYAAIGPNISCFRIADLTYEATKDSLCYYVQSAIYVLEKHKHIPALLNFT